MKFSLVVWDMVFASTRRRPHCSSAERRRAACQSASTNRARRARRPRPRYTQHRCLISFFFKTFARYPSWPTGNHGAPSAALLARADADSFSRITLAKCHSKPNPSPYRRSRPRIVTSSIQYSPILAASWACFDSRRAFGQHVHERQDHISSSLLSV